MQAADALLELMEVAPQSKREFFFTAIRVTIFVILIAAAAWLMAAAYAPQPPVALLPSQRLTCPPDVVTYREPVASPQAVVLTEPPTASLTSCQVLLDKPGARSLTANEEPRRRQTNKAPTYAFARNGVASKHTTAGESTKRDGTGKKQKSKPSTVAAILAQSGNSPSPFSDTHGQ
jgi:hypothetical protein